MRTRARIGGRELWKSSAAIGLRFLLLPTLRLEGSDVDQVSHVFNYDMPTEEETYVHRIRRSGRAVRWEAAYRCCDPEERRMLRSIEKLIGFSIRQLSLGDFDLSESATGC
jgi:superfamily II DNA/RNA helicase